MMETPGSPLKGQKGETWYYKMQAIAIVVTSLFHFQYLSCLMFAYVNCLFIICFAIILTFVQRLGGGRRKNVKKGFQFTLMVVGMFYQTSISLRTWIINFSVLSGASGTGRTTFVNTLCGSKVLSSKICDNPEEAHIEDGIKIRPISVGMYSLLCGLQLCSTNQTLLWFRTRWGWC